MYFEGTVEEKRISGQDSNRVGNRFDKVQITGVV